MAAPELWLVFTEGAAGYEWALTKDEAIQKARAQGRAPVGAKVALVEDVVESLKDSPGNRFVQLQIGAYQYANRPEEPGLEAKG